MRLLIPVLITLLTGNALADETAPLQLKGHARIRTELADHTNYSAVRTMTLLRVRPQVQWRANPKGFVLFEPQFARTLGERGVSAGSTTGAADQMSGATSDPSLGVHQAYLAYDATDSLRILAGRQILSFGDELILGALEWNNVGRSFDAARLQHRAGSNYVSDTFWAKLVESNATASGTGDYDFFGTYHAWKFESWLRELDAYLLVLNDTRGEARDPMTLGSVGLRARTRHDTWDTRLEATRQAGQIAGYPKEPDGTQVDFEMGKTWAALQSVRAGLGGFYADEDYQQFFPTTHRWLGYADVFGRRNLMGPRAHATFAFNERVKLTADYHVFYRVDRHAPVYQTSGTALPALRSDARLLGSEGDLVTTYGWDERNSLQAGYAIFVAASSMRALRDENPQFGYVSWEMKF